MQVDFTHLNLHIGQEKIERIGDTCKDKFFKFVGIRLDEHLTWSHQINHVHSKLASGNFAIAQTKNFLPKRIRMTIYNSLFRSHMEFGILAWGGVSQSKLEKITKLQKKCVRNVAGKGFNSHTDPIFSTLGILKFSDIFQYNSSIFMHKYINNKLPESFLDFFTPFSNPNRTHSFKTSLAKKKFLENFPSFFLPVIWNSNSLSLKATTNLGSFKNNLKQLMLGAYPPTKKCNSAFCPDCK